MTSLAVLLHGLTVNFLHFTGQDKMWTFCRILNFSTFESERKALNCLPLPLHSLNALKLMQISINKTLLLESKPYYVSL